MYHQSPEFINLWLIYCKKYQPNSPEAKLEPIEIYEPSQYYKYKPNSENCLPKTQRPTNWDLTWEEWNATAEPPIKVRLKIVFRT